MKNISIQDCYNLKKKFDKYTKTAEQHQFVQLAMIETMFNRTCVLEFSDDIDHG